MASEQETQALAALYKEAWDELRRYIYDREPERREKVIERYQGRIAAWNTRTASQPEREDVLEEAAREVLRLARNPGVAAGDFGKIAWGQALQRLDAALTTPAPAVSTDDAIEQIVVGFSDKAILRLDIEEDDPRLSRVCDDMRQTVRAILSDFASTRPMTEDVAGLVDDFTSALRLGVEDDVTIPFDLAVRIHATLTTPAPAVKPHCSTCGKDVAEVLCETCGKWWADNPPPAPAVSTDEIVAVLERCSEIVDRNLHRQREKVEDVPRMLRQLASRIRGEGE
jgi:hypothetical protein